MGKVFVIELPEPPHLPQQSSFGARIRSASGLTSSEIQNDPILSMIHDGAEAVVTALEIVIAITAVTAATPVAVVIGALVGARSLFGSVAEIDPNDNIFGILDSIAEFFAKKFVGTAIGDFLIKYFKAIGHLLAEIAQQVVDIIVEKVQEGIKEITSILVHSRD